MSGITLRLPRFKAIRRKAFCFLPQHGQRRNDLVVGFADLFQRVVTIMGNFVKDGLTLSGRFQRLY